MWPDQEIESVDLDGWPLLHVTVTTPRDQAPLHRFLANLGYCPRLVESGTYGERWRFHHPEGPPREVAPYLILMPFTDQAYADACLAGMHPEVRENVLAVDNTVENTGAAASYNIGARHVLARGLTWLVTLSPSTRFGPSGGRDFVRALGEHADAWVVEAGMPVGWHLIAWHRRVFENVGLWDEHFWPVYGEDADISQRILVGLRDRGIDNAWRVFESDAWLTMQGYSAHVGGVDVSGPQEAIWAYYVDKWGGRSGEELWDRPWRTKLLDYWPTPADPMAPPEIRPVKA